MHSLPTALAPLIRHELVTQGVNAAGCTRYRAAFAHGVPMHRVSAGRGGGAGMAAAGLLPQCGQARAHTTVECELRHGYRVWLHACAALELAESPDTPVPEATALICIKSCLQ